MEKEVPGNKGRESLISSTSKIRRPRISKACNFCRYRKIKCDGKRPCSNCQQTEIPNCVYTGKSTKDLKNDRKVINKSMESRLSRVENLLEGLSTQLPLSTKTQNGSQSPPTQQDSDETQKLGKAHIDRLPGSHFHVCKHSTKFVDRIKSQLPSQHHDLLIPFKNLPKFFSDSVKAFERKWVGTATIENKSRVHVLNKDLPTNQKLVMELIQNDYSQDFWANLICPMEEIQELFEKYYHNTSFRTENICDSDMLILNIALVISIREELDKQSNNNDLINELQTIYEHCFSRAILYYQRVLLLNEGIQTVKALMLLLIYTEYNIANSRLDHGLLCLAIRYAQDLGLLRNCTYFYGSNIKSTRMQRLWCAIEHFDIEMAYRKGIRPMMEINDVILADFEHNEGTENFNDEFFGISDSFDHLKAFYNFNNILSPIRYQTFSLIIDSKKDITFVEFMKKLHNLKIKMEKFLNEFPFRYRPFLASDRRFNSEKLKQWITTSTQSNMEKYSLLTAHVYYISHLMFINTIPSMYDTPESSELNELYAEFRSSSADCARTILGIAAALDCQEASIAFSNTIIHHIVSALMCLLYECVTNPRNSRSSGDLSLLLVVCNTFFSSSISEDILKLADSSKLSKKRKYELLCVAALNIGTKIIDFQLKTNTDYSETEFGLHVKKLRLKFPSIFMKSPANEAANSVISNSSHDSISNSNFGADQAKNGLFPSRPSSRGFDYGLKDSRTGLYSLDPVFTQDYTYSLVPASEKGPNVVSPVSAEAVGSTVWNDLPLPLVDNGMSDLHDFFFDSNFGI